MVVVQVLYPAGHPFDLDYYRAHHLPLVRRLLEPNGMTELMWYRPDGDGPFQLVAELRFPDRASTDAALSQHGPETQADIPNFTSAPPVILIGALEAA